jgi:molecular chaperone GrpE
MSEKEEPLQDDENITAQAEEQVEQTATHENLDDSFEAKYLEMNDKYLRLYSEFDNFRKRTSKEKIDLIQSGGEAIFKELLPVLDDFERAIKSNENTEDVDALKEGFNLIATKFKASLVKKGLEEMITVGEVFNADFHEALTSIPAPSEAMKGKVVDELEKGYKINGKIIRFAKVVIGN